MLKIEGFREREKQAPIFMEEEGFLDKAGDSVFERANGWYEAAFEGAKKPEADSEEDAKKLAEAPHPRIVLRDSERTLLDDADRQRLARLLTRLHVRFNDYSQGMGFVAAFLSLFLEQDKAEEILRCMHTDPKFIPGYWASEAVGFATDANVFGDLLAKRHPDLAAHLQRCAMLPEMYCQKWFTSLCVHVLSFEHLFAFWDRFFRRGYPFLFQFALALMDALKDRMLATSNPGDLLALLRLDKEALGPDFDCGKVIRSADNVDVSAYDFEALRVAAYDTHLRARMERARRAREEEDSDDEIVFSDEEDEDADAESSGFQ